MPSGCARSNKRRRPVAKGWLTLACGFLAACSGTPSVDDTPDAHRAEGIPEVQPEAEPAPAAPATPEPAPDAPVPALTLALVGDIMLGTDYPEDRLPDDDGAGFLAPVADVLRAADLAIGNLEGVLADGGEPRKACRNPAACFLFRSPTRYATHLRDAGFDLMSVANNHARDFGEAGRDSSMAALTAVGIRHSGRRGEFASFEKAGLRIAFLAYAVTRNSNLLHDYALAETTIRGYGDSHDIVIVSFHGGAEGGDVARLPFAEEEYFGEPRGDVLRFARMAVDAGADVVFGHGPHVIRAAERYRGRLIAYSLGNFATYYGISVAGNKGIAPILEVTVDAEGRFLEGRVVSTRQVRPAGPTVDPQSRALKTLATLSHADLGNPGLVFHDDGRLTIRPRETSHAPVERRFYESSEPTDLKSTPSDLSLR